MDGSGRINFTDVLRVLDVGWHVRNTPKSPGPGLGSVRSPYIEHFLPQEFEFYIHENPKMGAHTNYVAERLRFSFTIRNQVT